MVLLISVLMGVRINWNPLHLLGVVVVVVLSAAAFACLSLVIAAIVRIRDRLMGIGQAITMPLFFASSALYPVSIMPGWVRAITIANPMSYEVSALRALLVGTPTNYLLDLAVLTGSTLVLVGIAGALLGGLSR